LKKIISILLIIAMLFGLCACSYEGRYKFNDLYSLSNVLTELPSEVYYLDKCKVPESFEEVQEAYPFLTKVSINNSLDLKYAEKNRNTIVNYSYNNPELDGEYVESNFLYSFDTNHISKLNKILERYYLALLDRYETFATWTDYENGKFDFYLAVLEDSEYGYFQIRGFISDEYIPDDKPYIVIDILKVKFSDAAEAQMMFGGKW